MPLVTATEILQKARHKGYAVPAFAAYTLESLTAITQTADELRSPVIIQTTESTIKFAGLLNFSDAVRAVASRTGVPVVLHLDHGSSIEIVAQCIRAGYTSVMIDASQYPFEENIRRVKQVVQIAHAAGVSVEAEIGHIAGVEDDVADDTEMLTDPSAAEEFAQATSIDSIAVSIGSAHGLYKKSPSLDLDRLSQIAQKVEIPIVLHGASGIPQHMVRDAIKRGISKVNIATELKASMAGALKSFFERTPGEIDPRTYLTELKDAVRAKVSDVIRMVGSEGMAD